MPVPSAERSYGVDHLWAAARRGALDHVLALTAQAPWSEGLVLRGSMALAAWEPGGAREPQDLDWIVPGGAVAVDQLSPFPYLDELAAVQQWPEAAHGAAGHEFWAEEEFDDCGSRPRIPPEGLRWLPRPDHEDRPYGNLLDLVADSPQAAAGVRLDADRARVDASWGYAYAGDGGEPSAGVRLLIPWTAEGVDEPGAVQLDFALDEALPDAPRFAAVPRADGGAPAVVRAASREASLAWKLLWLHTDNAAQGACAAKDLYDAVLLAESPRTRLTARLIRRVLRTASAATTSGIGAAPGAAAPLTATAIQAWRVPHWPPPAASAGPGPGAQPVRGGAPDWLERLARATAATLSELGG